MATVSDITTTPLSGLTYIDALLDSGPDWNYLTPVGNTIKYTFSITSGTEDAQSTSSSFTGVETAFSVAQQAAVRTALAYISALTGIQFVETTVGTDAQIHLANANLTGSNVTGLCSWQSSYGYSGTQLVSYDADAYVYLDNVEWASQNSNLTPGGAGYETLLHELGHALGLKHPFDTTDDNTTVLSAAQDNTSNTLMSYTHLSSTSYSTYRADDIAALEWLYGGDGLRGALGINSTDGARYIVGSSGADTLTGTDANDKFQGNGGNDMIDGGAGTDTALFSGARKNYTITTLANGDLQVADTTGTDGTDTLHAVEVLQFSDTSVTRADLAAADTTAPSAPTLAVTMNGNGYAQGSEPLVTGVAEANSTVKIYTSGNVLVGTTTADATGAWSTDLSAFKDGLNYLIYATATDAAGNTSVASATATFNVDATAPVVPTVSVTHATGSNLATFSGTGEAGTTIELVRSGDYIDIAVATVGSNGKWSVTTAALPDGSYQVSAVSSDKADNATVSASTVSFTVASTDNFTGTSGNDTLVARANSNAIDGGAGIDTVVYSGASTNYTVSAQTWGYGVTDKVGTGGHDSVINVERLQFDDTMVALDIDGTAGEVFRLYQAAFDRPAEAAGLGYWIWRMDNGTTLAQVAQEFQNQVEFNTLYGDNPSNAEFVTNLYENVLHREAEGAGYDYWMNILDTNAASRTDVLIDFSESPENQAQVIGTVQNGIAYTAWTG